jgi:formylglycine-generating enzyme required for sulfatase activity
MDDDRTEPSPLAARGPGVRFENVKVARSGSEIDVTFDVGWNDAWGPGRRGEGFCPENWDAAWIFFKYRPARLSGEWVAVEIPLDQKLLELLDLELPVTPILREKRELFARGQLDPDPWLGADEVVRAVVPGSSWTLDLRTGQTAPWHRINLVKRKAREGGGDVLALSSVRRWKHAQISEVRGEPPEGARIALDEDRTGAFLYSASKDFRGDARYRGVRLRCALIELPLDLDPRAEVEIWPLGLEMVYVPKAPFWLGDPAPRGKSGPRNCFFDALASRTAVNQAYHVASEAPIDVGPPEAAGRPPSAKQLLWYSNDDDARGAGDHHRIHASDALSPNEKWAASRIPAEFPKGYDAFYVMKRQVTQGEYAAFVNALDGGDSRDSYGQLVRFPWDGSGSHRGTIGLVKGSRKRTAARPGRPCNHLSWSDAMAFAAWAGLRPMTELEYEKACRGPLDPVSGEFSWGKGPVVLPSGGYEDIRAREILGFEDGTEVALGQCNINNDDPLAGGDGGTGPIRDDAFDTRRPAEAPSTFWLNRTPDTPAAASGGERERRGLSYYGIAGLTGNLWELTITAAVREGRAFQGTHGAGEVDELGDAPWQTLGWPDQLGKGLSWRGGSWYTDWRRGLVAARPYGSGAPGFFLRSNDAGFRAARSARSTNATLQYGEVDTVKDLVRLWQPDKLLWWLPLDRARDDAAVAALFGVGAAGYRAIRENVDDKVGQRARKLLADEDLRRRVVALPFRKNARILGVGDDLLGDRQSFVSLLRYVLEATQGDSMLGVLNAGLRAETTAQMVGRVADLVHDGFGGAPVDLVVCLAGVSDVRRPDGLGRMLLGADQTRANLMAIRKLAEPLVPLGPRPPGQPWPRWIWVTAPRLDPWLVENMTKPRDFGQQHYTPDPRWAPLSNDDLGLLADTVRAVAAQHPEDGLVDLHAMSDVAGIALVQHTSQGAGVEQYLHRFDTPHLELDDHARIVRSLVDLLSPA